MQRVALRAHSVRTIVAVLAASALLTAGLGASAQSATTAPAHVCPPVC